LGQRLPRSVVISESGAVNAKPDATVSINIRRLDANASGLVVVQAQAAVVFGKKTDAPVLRDLRFTVPPAGSDMTAQVAALSVAVGQVADVVAGMIAAGGAPAAMPPPRGKAL